METLHTENDVLLFYSLQEIHNMLQLQPVRIIARNSQYATTAASEDDFVVLSLFESIQFWKQGGFYQLIKEL